MFWSKVKLSWKVITIDGSILILLIPSIIIGNTIGAVKHVYLSFKEIWK